MRRYENTLVDSGAVPYRKKKKKKKPVLKLASAEFKTNISDIYRSWL